MLWKWLDQCFSAQLPWPGLSTSADFPACHTGLSCWGTVDALVSCTESWKGGRGWRATSPVQTHLSPSSLGPRR